MTEGVCVFLTVDPRKRELLAQLLRAAVVRLDVERAPEEERFVEMVQFLLDGLGPRSSAVNARRPTIRSVIVCLR